MTVKPFITFYGYRVDETDLNGNSVRFVGAYATKEEAEKHVPRFTGDVTHCLLIEVNGRLLVLAPGTIAPYTEIR